MFEHLFFVCDIILKNKLMSTDCHLILSIFRYLWEISDSVRTCLYHTVPGLIYGLHFCLQHNNEGETYTYTRVLVVSTRPLVGLYTSKNVVTQICLHLFRRINHIFDDLAPQIVAKGRGYGLSEDST